jgi:hypothetical protein
MDHLSSCYFCGTAMDDPPQVYRVVPVELRDDDATTATLCGACHGKLERILAPVAEAAGAGGATLDPAGTDSGRTPTATGGTDSGDVGGVGETTESQATAAGSDDASGEGESRGSAVGRATDADPAGTGADLVDVDALEADPLESGRDTGNRDDSRSAEHGRTDAGPDGGSDQYAGRDTEAGRSEEDVGGDRSGGSGVGDRNGGDGGDDGEDSVGGDGEDPDERQEGDDDPEAGDPAGGTARTTVSALEYNKVMRLLQNREFPVDRPEIQTVAANAYGLAEHECAEVIDLAIDRGLIAERNGQLVRPD